jgi:hypothetical protein
MHADIFQPLISFLEPYEDCMIPEVDETLEALRAVAGAETPADVVDGDSVKEHIEALFDAPVWRDTNDLAALLTRLGEGAEYMDDYVALYDDWHRAEAAKLIAELEAAWKAATT